MTTKIIAVDDLYYTIELDKYKSGVFFSLFKVKDLRTFPAKKIMYESSPIKLSKVNGKPTFVRNTDPLTDNIEKAISYAWGKVTPDGALQFETGEVGIQFADKTAMRQFLNVLDKTYDKAMEMFK